MDVHFIDTSVFLNIINVPDRNQNREEVLEELSIISENGDTLLLPFATIIETGNHIAQNGDGNQRRKSAERFCEIIRKTIRNEAPWKYYGQQMTEADLQSICENFQDSAMREVGFGDLSIIQAYEKYKNDTPAINRIRIWSIDKHLMIFDEKLHNINMRN